ncbi:hypothetical protein JQX13_04440 [Archangium violaceum]|uniref:hypothetical protein n=1 Tax=Archangium violaceum TaxID=83451 RepID=UPI00193C7FAD|nr:hypothetical protein [Archangium violaceum]QRK09399.1 hypothetical protein JQX13_04440 [Archangium violaceum]
MSEVLDDVLRNLDRTARAPLQQTERQRALQHALGWGLAAALQHWKPQAPEAPEMDRLRDWMRERIVSKELLHLVHPRADSQLDVRRLQEEMEASGLGAKHLGQPDTESLLRELTVGFYRGIEEQPALHEVVPLAPLRHVAERLGAQLTAPSKSLFR